MSIRFHTPTYDITIQVIACFLVIVLVNLVSIESGYITLLGIVLLLLLTVFSLRTQIEVQEKSITISKSYLGYEYFKYQWNYVYVHIENNYVISFANVLSTRLRLECDFDDTYNYFVCYVNGRKVVLGKEKDFDKFKVQLQE